MNNKNPYSVPEGYFKGLQESILSKTVLSRENSVRSVDLPPMEHILAEDDTASELDIRPRVDIGASKQTSWRSLVGFAAGFAAMVALAWGGFYFMTGAALEREALMASEIDIESMTLYGVDEMQLLDILNDDEHNYLLAEAAMDYVNYFGGASFEDLFAE